MQKYAVIILLVVLLVALGLYVSFGIDKGSEGQPQQQAADPNYVEYVDSVNHVRLSHHKDWQASSSFGFIRLLPKGVSADFQSLTIELWAPVSKVTNSAFEAEPSVEITPERFVRLRHEEIPWKDGTGKTLDHKTTKTYMHWAVSSDRNVLLEAVPGQQPASIDPRIKKVIESMKFE
jgi:hypothetical protein